MHRIHRKLQAIFLRQLQQASVPVCFMSLPTRREHIGRLGPHETFSISTPSVRVTIAADLVTGMMEGTPLGPGRLFCRH